jgi:hypothetical protein
MTNCDFKMIGKNSRYIKTKVDGLPKILHMMNCNFCPLMIFDRGPKVTRCAKFHGISTNMTDDNIYSYSVIGINSIPIKEVSIPDWCGLCSDILLINNDSSMYVKSGHNTYDIIPNIYQNLVIVSALYISYDTKLNSLIYSTNKKLNCLNFGYNSNSTLPVKIETSTPNPIIPILITCSCCGNLVEGVSRENNLGMCSICWEKYKDDKKMKEFCFINNFRLKRSAKWSDEVYKNIKEID